LLKVLKFCFKNIVFFLVNGSCGYVLPRIQNRVFLELKQGEYFGHSELASNKKFIDLTNFKSLNGTMMRNFTV